MFYLTKRKENNKIIDKYQFSYGQIILVTHLIVWNDVRDA